MQRFRGCLTLFLSLVIWTSLSTTLKAYVPPVYSGGDGTSGNPFQIGSKADLLTFMNDGSSASRSAHYILTVDVDLTGEAWTSIGTVSTPFTGSFDGNSHAISNLTMAYTTSLDTEAIGLFGVCTNCTISNLNLSAVTLNILSDDANLMVGALVGLVTADTGTQIYDIDASGDVVVTYVNDDTEPNSDVISVGGVVGRFVSTSPALTYDKIAGVNSRVNTSFSVLDLAATTNTMTISVGGVAGYTQDAAVQESTVNGATITMTFDPLNVTYDALFAGSQIDVGGLVGSVSQTNDDFGPVGYPVVAGNAVGHSDPVFVNGVFNVGGMIGRIYATNRTNVIDNTVEDVNVTGKRNVGGLVGEGVSTDLKENFLETITLTASTVFELHYNANFGGVGGYLSGAPEVNDNVVVDLNTSNLLFANVSSVGGQIGLAGEDTEIMNGVVTASFIDGTSNVGGFIGSGHQPTLYSSKIFNTTLRGTYSVGGLVGVMYGDGMILESYADVEIEAISMVGGLIGSSISGTITINRSFSLGEIAAEQDIGGLIGLANSINLIEDCFSRMDLHYMMGSQPTGLNGIAEAIVGGIIGYDLGHADNLYENLYFAGTITALENVSPYVGPIIGYSYSSIPVDVSPQAIFLHLYYDNTLYTGPNSTTLGVGLSTAQMMSASHYTGFDFSTVWSIDALYNGGYAYLNEGFILVLFVNGSDSFGYQDYPGDHVIEPADPTRLGYIFGGWYVDQTYTNPWNFETGIANTDVTLYAKWTAQLPDTGQLTSSAWWIGSLGLGLWLMSRKRKPH